MFMAYTVDYAILNGTKKNKTHELIELSLLGFYLLELILRILAERWYFLFAPYGNWNMLDFLLVCFSVNEVVMEFFLPQGVGLNMGFFRAVRIFKVLKRQGDEKI